MEHLTAFSQSTIPKFTIPKLTQLSLVTLALTAGSTLVSQTASAHGYVVSPESRSYACKTGSNVNCGAVQWEPQSVEGASGFPESGPADGKIASAANGAFSPLDEQSPSRWSKRDIKSGWNDFSWQFTANHVTRNWRYYLTRQGWDQNQPLSRASFDLAPFCVIDGGMVQPPKLVTHNCYVPEDRSGYQVILAVWEVGDTTNSFYNAIDVNFSSGAVVPGEWTDIGDINPSLDLKAGDKVMTRVFDANGEQSAKQTQITIADATQGAKQNWPFLLASAINAQQPQLKAGQKNAAGVISPVYGKNEIFAAPKSGLERVEVSFDIAPAPGNQLNVTSLADDYTIVDGAAQVSFDVSTNADMQVSAYLFSHDGTAAGYVTQAVNNTSASLVLDVVAPKAGHYHLQVKAEPKQGEVIQQNFDLFLKDQATAPDADFIFPEGIKSYVAGTKVLQPKTGKVYQCKPWPYNGYCVQWSPTATGFEPGIGNSWTMAWTEL
ncbi:N-acetylglucosamine-binding protein GbpA [Shewanella oneidensis]|uniref:N-acetylglucosamine-binding protein GbpA n=1 Tax=Shewanella oneidensis TaxID=70863 RepID=UPI00000E19AF|nr:N-acetylglucosamine-binding protein GbpA [Shewanella oneidensis]AAN54144.1 N-acetylglucosamine-binding protein A GbpA [Shewanella oneidensis MR-1]MDX5997055.1 N-acetylglucosamine-binding protein GbpA [Shewanella oneidensis]MEE2028051.1 GlcNAc-binding protein A [Shewanella oneidensis]